MLTSEHAIVEFKAGRAIPDRLRQSTHRHDRDYAERMLSIYREGLGRQRRELHRQIEMLFADEPECPPQRLGVFCKLLDDRSRFQRDSGGAAGRLRLEVFSAGARFHPLVQAPDQLFDSGERATKEKIAKDLGLSVEEMRSRLYADVMSYHRLEAFEGYPDGAALLSRYAWLSCRRLFIGPEA